MEYTGMTFCDWVKITTWDKNNINTLTSITVQAHCPLTSSVYSIVFILRNAITMCRPNMILKEAIHFYSKIIAMSQAKIWRDKMKVVMQLKNDEWQQHATYGLQRNILLNQPHTKSTRLHEFSSFQQQTKLSIIS